MTRRAPTRTHVLLAGGALLTAAVLACTGPRGTVNAPVVDLTIAPIGSLPEGGIATNGQRSPATGQCSLRLVAARIQKSSPGCYLDEHISEGPGILRYPCSGDGPAEAEFGTQKYTGKIESGELELEASTELDWEDGCRWGTDATIRGTVVAGRDGHPTRQRLEWTYRDRIISGSGCSGICTAKTTIAVSSTDASAHSDDDDDDDDDDAD